MTLDFSPIWACRSTVSMLGLTCTRLWRHSSRLAPSLSPGLACSLSQLLLMERLCAASALCYVHCQAVLELLYKWLSWTCLLK